MSAKTHTLLAFALVCAIGVFYLATIRKGHVWGDDQAAYIHHAKNIAEGKPYGDIGYILTPTSLNPKMYPPVFPLLLAPCYRFFGLSLTPMKVLCILFFCAALLLFYFLAREGGNEFIALGTLAVVGLCPYFWDFKDSVFSECPFLALAYGALLLARRAAVEPQSGGSRLGWGAAAGLLAALASGTRSAGIVLLPVIVLSEFARVKRFTRFSVSVCAAFVGCTLLFKLLFRVDSDYLGSYLRTISVKELLGGLFYYFKAFSVMWENGANSTIQFSVYALLCGLAVYGGITRTRKSGWSILELFGLGYLAFILLFPWGGRRYLMPIMPVFVFMALSGLQSLISARSPGFRLAARISFATVIGLGFGWKYGTLNWDEVPDGIQSRETGQLVETVKRRAGGTDIVVFRKARFLALYAGTRTMDVFVDMDPEVAMGYYRKAGASLFVVSRLFNDEMERALDVMVQGRHDAFERVYEDGPFSIYTWKKG